MTIYQLLVRKVNVKSLRETSNTEFQLTIFFWAILGILEHKNRNLIFSPKKMKIINTLKLIHTKQIITIKTNNITLPSVVKSMESLLMSLCITPCECKYANAFKHCLQTVAICSSSILVCVTMSVRAPPSKYSITTHNSSPTKKLSYMSTMFA